MEKGLSSFQVRRIASYLERFAAFSDFSILREVVEVWYGFCSGLNAVNKVFPNGSPFMELIRKNPLFFILLAVLTLGVFYVATCSHLCPSGNYGIGFLQHVNCAFQSHSVTNVGIGLSVLFVLPLLGLFLLIDIIFSPQELSLSRFKPPRLPS